MIHQFAKFLEERHRIYLRRLAGHSAPWTADPILRSGYFTNVYRENDRTTRWIAEHWRDAHRDDPDLWFAMTVARNVNLPDTLEELGYPVPWNKEYFLAIMKGRAAGGKKSYSGAYMIRAGKTDGDIKASYQAERQFDIYWENRARLRPREGDTLGDYYNVLLPEHGFGSFLAQQVIADLMYVEPLRSAEDWFRWSAPGPGSVQGLNLILGQSLKRPWKTHDFQEAVEQIQDYINRHWEWYPYLHAQNITNGLCEFSKYKKAELGITPVRRRYKYEGVKY